MTSHGVPTLARDWWRHAACQGVELETFFGREAAQALQLCAACPVAEHCLAEALQRESELPESHRRHGIWGGMLPEQREQYVRGERDFTRIACPACGKLFFPPRGHTVFCGRACRSQDQYAQKLLSAAGVPGEPVHEGWAPWRPQPALHSSLSGVGVHLYKS